MQACRRTGKVEKWKVENGPGECGIVGALEGGTCTQNIKQFNVQ